MSGTSTGVQMESGLIQDNYIHDMGYDPGDHINGMTTNSGTALLTIRHNTILNTIDQTDAIRLFEDFGAQSNRIIDNNLVAGGGYTIYGGANPGGAATSNIKITNNRFSRVYYPNGGYYGPSPPTPPTAPATPGPATSGTTPSPPSTPSHRSDRCVALTFRGKRLSVRRDTATMLRPQGATGRLQRVRTHDPGVADDE